MKKILFAVAVFTAVFTVQAQEAVAETPKQNDILISPIELIAIPLLNFSYERLLNENSGVGINGMFYFGNNDDDDEYGMTQISPYYRMYFGRKYASGFFVEGFVPITTTKDTYYETYTGPGYFNQESRVESNTTVGVGIGFGGKWIARNNVVFEASTGIARRFGMPERYNSAITGKGMLGIGYRF